MHFFFLAGNLKVKVTQARAYEPRKRGTTPTLETGGVDHGVIRAGELSPTLRPSTVAAQGKLTLVVDQDTRAVPDGVCVGEVEKRPHFLLKTTKCELSRATLDSSPWSSPCSIQGPEAGLWFGPPHL